ncbi:unnamed protein product [Aureobasidium mustum]|uniref:Uncharacterized protein n=1 Tax=Aureobasidium mustum TaxID=2773714 RepID=A0A9N8K1Z2_9PEZI|nr:unnamed protein product [Aureobasidium mustum]
MYSHTIDALPAYNNEMPIFNLAMTLIWGAAELLLSIGFITAFSFMVCYGFGAAMDPKGVQADDDDESDVPSKENTASIFMSAMLSGFHVTFVFFGLPLFGHATESFVMRLIYSTAIIAALTTAVALSTIVFYLLAPVVSACWRGITGLFRKTPAQDEQDIEAQHEREAFLDEKKLESEVE